MARQRKAAEQLRREGAFDKNPKRRRKDLAGKGRLPDSPPRGLKLTPEERDAWLELAAWIPAGITSGSDRFVVERLARLLARSRGGGKWTAADETQLRAYFGALGLHPAARATLGGGGGEAPTNEFDEFGKSGGRDEHIAN